MFLPTTNTYMFVHLAIGWGSMSLGVLSGAVMGLLFHKEDWLGGYGSVPRRMIRLGHISFFGMGALNMFWAGTLFVVTSANTLTSVSSVGLLVATISMPVICFYCGARGINRALFVIPVAATCVLLVGACGLVVVEFGDVRAASVVKHPSVCQTNEHADLAVAESVTVTYSEVL